MKLLRIIIISYIFCPMVIFGQEKVEVFTWHPDGKPVALYDDASLTKKRIDVYPDVEEGMAGMIFYIDVESDSCLRVITDPLDYLYVRKGTLAVNTRNYNKRMFPFIRSSGCNVETCISIACTANSYCIWHL